MKAPSRVLTSALVLFVGATALYALFGPAPRSGFVEGAATITGVVARPPEIRAGAQQIILKTEKGRVLVRVGRFPEYQYGDALNVVCTLKAPRRTDTFDEAHFLYPQKIFITCPFPDAVAKIGELGNQAVALVFYVKLRFTERLERVLPAAEAALAAGLLFGDRDLPARDYANFLATGTSHIIAVSGYNVAIITQMIFPIFAFLFGRRRTLGLIILFIVAYVVATGASASVVRAAIMAIIPFLAKALGRPVYGGNLLLLTAALMLGTNPYLVYDLGFILSFAATAGIIYLSPILLERFREAKKSSAPLVRAIMTISIPTFSAIVVTLPIVIASFGRISLIAPVANLFILFVLPAAMLTAFLAGVISLPLVGTIAGFAAYILHRYILAVADLFARIPGASIALPGGAYLPFASLTGTAILVFIVAYIVRVRRRALADRVTAPAVHAFILDNWRVEDNSK